MRRKKSFPKSLPQVRTQMAFSVGHIIGAMKDYDLMFETLKDFVKTLEPNYDVEQAEGNIPILINCIVTLRLNCNLNRINVEACHDSPLINSDSE
jgi:hypothetical protein